MALIQAYGLWILAPFAILEGPIVTILAAYLAQRGFLPVIGVYLVCIGGDLVGDALLSMRWADLARGDCPPG